MSVIVEMPSLEMGKPGQLILFTKGADTIMFDLEEHRDTTGNLNTSIASVDKSEEIKKHINRFSCKGYRTLAFSYRFLKRDEYKDWEREFEKLKYDMAMHPDEKERRQQGLIA